MWFDSNGIPLKWHYPIGMCLHLFEKFQRQQIILNFQMISGVLFELTKRDDELPWCITIHFSKFPEEILFRCPNR